MVKRRNLRPDPRRAMADLLAKQAAQTKALGTVPTGVKDLGETGDAVWTDPESGEESSVRELPALIDETAVAIEAAKKELEETRGDLEGAKADLDAERAAREAALADATAALAELDEKLEAGPSTADLDSIRDDLAAARAVAESATTSASEANTAALAASQAALEAAGIAASKGRVIVSETEPTGADRTPSNIWIRPVPDDPDTEVQESAVTYVYLEASDEWQATTSSELAQAAQNALDAREAAQQAQQRADTAVSSAAAAQAAAEAAQRTADTATLNAADAHNAAVAAQSAADAAKADALLSNLCFNPGFEQAGASPSTADGWTTDAGREYRDTSRSRSGSASLCLDPTVGTGVAYVFPPPARYAPVSPERQYKLSAWVYLGAGGEIGAERQLRLRWYDAAGADLGWTHAAAWTASTARGEWAYVESATGPARAKAATARVEVSHNGGQPAWVDDVALRDVTEVMKLEAAAKAAQSRADAAMSEAASKATPAQVDAARQAAIDAAKADATAKADTAQQAATAAAASDAASKAAAAQAAATTAAAADAKAKADAAEAAAKSAATADAKAKADAALVAAKADAKTKADAAQAAATTAAAADATAKADAAKAAAAADAKAKADAALAAARADLAAARTQITAEIKASANGKNAITVSTAAPTSSTPGGVAGDTWWRVDGSGTIYGQWAWTGSAWSARTIRSEVIANLDVGKLVVTGSSRFTEAVVDRLFADVFAAHKITASELTIAAVGEDGELVADSVRGVHIQDGTVSANKIIIDGDPENPDEVGLVARIASIMQLAVEHLVVTDGATIDSAVILKLASEMVTAGVIRTAETGQRVVIDQGGVVLIGLDDDGFEYELVRLGPSGDNLLTIGKTTVAPDGVATPSLEAGAVSVNGRDVTTLPDDGARGVVAWAYSTSNSAWDGSGSEVDRMRISALLRPGRLYSVTMDQKLIRTRTGATGPRFLERLRFNAGDVGKSGQLAISVSSLPASTITYSTPGFTGWLNMDDLGNTEDTPVQVWWSTQGMSGRDYRIEGSPGQAVRLTLRDEGPAVGSSGIAWFDTGTPAEGSADAPPKAVEKTTRTEKFAATRAESWNRGSSSFLSGKSGTVYQGKYPSVSAREGAWWFNSLTGNLSGATIKRVQLRFYVTHTYWGAGGTADVRLHGKTGFTTGGLDTSIKTLKVKRNAQYSIDVPAQYLDGFRTGTWRGFGLSTSSTNLEYYVQARLANAEIWVTYER